MNVIKPKAEHEVAYQDICALVNKHADKLSAVELLAIASNMIGKLIAYQDQNALSSEKAMAIVAANIEIGNKQVREAIAEQLLSGKKH